MNDASELLKGPELVEFGGLVLPRQCPACGAEIERELHLHGIGAHPPQFTLTYHCGTMINTTPGTRNERLGQNTNVSSGCRVMTLKSLTGET